MPYIVKTEKKNMYETAKICNIIHYSSQHIAVYELTTDNHKPFLIRLRMQKLNEFVHVLSLFLTFASQSGESPLLLGHIANSSQVDKLAKSVFTFLVLISNYEPC